MTANTIFNQTPDQIFSTALFGNDLLPRPLEVPGRAATSRRIRDPRLRLLKIKYYRSSGKSGRDNYAEPSKTA